MCTGSEAGQGSEPRVGRDIDNEIENLYADVSMFAFKEMNQEMLRDQGIHSLILISLAKLTPQLRQDNISRDSK